MEGHFVSCRHGVVNWITGSEYYCLQWCNTMQFDT